MIKQFLRPLLSVRPLRCMVDEKFEVRVQGLLPSVRVTLHALLHSEDGDLWEGFGHYVSDETGNVKVFKDASLGGSYAGVESMGLLWSMKPIPGSKTGLRFRKKDVQAQTDVLISVYKDHLTHGFQKKPPIASVVAQRWYTAPGVQRVDVTEKGLKGTLFIPPGPGPFPAVLDLWGGSGGLVEYRSALLASRGYVTLSLQYSAQMDAGGKLRNVGIDYFEPRCIVCVNGSHAIPVSGSLVDFAALVRKLSTKLHYDKEQRLICRDSLLPIPDDPLNKVEVDRIECPILLIVGEDDQNCPVSESADDMKQMMERGGNSHLLTVLSYPGAGHLIEPPYTPHCQVCNFVLADTKTKGMLLWGGQTEAHSQAQEDSWHKTLAFLEQHLYSSTSD